MRTDNIATHNSYSLGWFADDQIQNIQGTISFADGGYRVGIVEQASGAFYKSQSQPTLRLPNGGTVVTSTPLGDYVTFDASYAARAGTTTHSKEKGVVYLIKVL